MSQCLTLLCSPLPPHRMHDAAVLLRGKQVGSSVLLLSRLVGAKQSTDNVARLTEEGTASASKAVDRLANNIDVLEQRLGAATALGKIEAGVPTPSADTASTVESTRESVFPPEGVSGS